jgi:hypothetical protein
MDSAGDKIRLNALMVLSIALFFMQVSPVLVSSTGGPGPVWLVPIQSMGNGTVEDPYIVETLSDLQNISGKLSSHYRLGNDIDASSSSTMNGGLGFDPIGDYSNPFTGSFEGGGYTLRGLSINRAEQYIGLFGYITNARITNLTLDDVRITGSSYVGSLVGFGNSVSLESCHVTGTILGRYCFYVGGIAGWVEGVSVISRCSSKISFNYTDYVQYCGGIIGVNFNAYTHNNSFDGAFNVGRVPYTTYSLGGLMGYCYGAITESSSSQGTIITFGDYFQYVGGAVGTMYSGQLSDVSSSIDIRSVGRYHYYIGGLVGSAYNALISMCEVDASIDLKGTGQVRGYYIGGLVGLSSGQVDGSHARGVAGNRIEMILTDFTNLERVGGLIGGNQGPLADSTSEMDLTIKRTVVSGGINQYNYVGGLIGHNSWVVDNCSWKGSMIFGPTDTHTVNNLGCLMGYNSYSVSQCEAIGALRIRGNIDSIGGLIGQSTGTIIDSESNIYTLQSSVLRASRIGGLVGTNSGDILRCDVLQGMELDDVSVSLSEMGGLVGANGAKVKECQVSGDVGFRSGSPDVLNMGILIGSSTGPIEDCSITGNLSLTALSVQWVGGLVGYQKGATTNCHVISEMTIGSKNYVNGLGGLIGFNEDAKIDGSSSEVEMTVEGNCDVSSVGGLVGRSTGPISDSRTLNEMALNVDPRSTGLVGIGGMVGDNSRSVEGCQARTMIRLDLNADLLNKVNGIGGFIGTNHGDLKYSSSILDIAPTDIQQKYHVRNAGGLIGFNEGGTVDYCYSEGSLSLNNTEITDMGGFVGNNSGDIQNSYTLVDFYLYGSRSGSTIGGFVGSNDGEIGYTYCVPSQKGGDTLIYMGGFAGTNRNVLERSFFEDDEFKVGVLRIGPSSDTQLFGKSSVRMKQESNFTEQMWNFIMIWGIVEDRTYPFLKGIYTSPRIEVSPEIYCQEDTTVAIPYKVTFSNYPSINSLEPIIFDTDTDWLSIDAKKVYGTPDNEDVGMHWITLVVKDLVGEKAEVHLDFEVLNVNDPPEIVTEDIISISEGEDYSRYYYAVDVDPTLTRLFWNFSSDARWLKFEGNHLHGKPRSYDLGEYWVNISVSDAEGAVDFSNFTLEVLSANDPPVITTIPQELCFEDEVYSIPLLYEDPDVDDSITWTLISAPAWMRINRTHIYGRPGNDDVGISWMLLRIRDYEGATDELGFLLEVRNVNDAPVWVEHPDDVNITQGEVYLANAFASDVDVGDILSYGLESYPSSNISIDNSTGAIVWEDPVPGNYTIMVTSTDGIEIIEVLFNITVLERIEPVPDDGNPPIFDRIDDRTVLVGEMLKVQLTASDEDGDDLIFLLVEGPGDMVISADGLLVWTPGGTDLGVHGISILVTDGTLNVTAEFNVTVNESVDPGDGDGDGKEKKEEGPFLLTTIALAVLCAILLVLLLAAFLRSRGTGIGPTTDPVQRGSGLNKAEE